MTNRWLIRIPSADASALVADRLAGDFDRRRDEEDWVGVTGVGRNSEFMNREADVPLARKA
jgi:hypothetical protein